MVELPLFEGPATGAPFGHAHPAGLQGTLPNRAARHSKTHRCGLRRHMGGSPASGSCLRHLCTPRAAPGRPPRRRAAKLNTRLHGWDRSAAARGWRARRERLGTHGPVCVLSKACAPQSDPRPAACFCTPAGCTCLGRRAVVCGRPTAPVGSPGTPHLSESEAGWARTSESSNKISPLAVPRVARQPRARETHARPAPAVRSAGERRACAATHCSCTAVSQPLIVRHRRLRPGACRQRVPPGSHLLPGQDVERGELQDPG